MINSKQKDKTNRQVLKEKGSALILAIIVLVNALFIVVAVSSISIVERKMSIKTRNTAPAFQAADSGIEYVLGSDPASSIKNLCKDSSLDTDGKCVIDPNDIGGMDVAVYFIDSDGKIITDGESLLSDVNSVRSVGRYGEGGYATTRAIEMAMNASMDECTDSSSVGDNCGGGILFDTDDKLVAMPGGCDGNTDEPTCSGTDAITKKWSESSDSNDEPANSDTDGESNTGILLNSPTDGGSADDESTDDVDNPAALYCYNMIYRGYDDWYLPSINELDVLYNQNAEVESLAADDYWSSTQEDSSNAKEINFSDGTSGSEGKESPLLIRCIRDFGND